MHIMAVRESVAFTTVMSYRYIVAWLITTRLIMAWWIGCGGIGWKCKGKPSQGGNCYEKSCKTHVWDGFELISLYKRIVSMVEYIEW